jgi:hypothetical protein
MKYPEAPDLSLSFEEIATLFGTACYVTSERSDIVLAALRFVYTGVADYTGASAKANKPTPAAAGTASDTPSAAAVSDAARDFYFRLGRFARATRLPELQRRCEVRLLSVDSSAIVEH